MEQFFKVFSIKKVRECELRDECFLGFAHTCEKCDIYGQAYEVYPPITSDIVLGLLTLALDNGWKFTQYKTGEYVIERDSHEYCAIDKDFKTALLLMYCGYKDYKNSLTDISPKVRALFNAD